MSDSSFILIVKDMIVEIFRGIWDQFFEGLLPLVGESEAFEEPERLALSHRILREQEAGQESGTGED